MTDLTSCLSLVETRPGVFFPCAREHGHEGPHNPGRCNLPLQYEHRQYDCSLGRGHAGPHRTWVEEADLDALPDLSHDYEERETG